ncbi:MAG: zincin-like metallopeptidase domain-containing protein [Patescibacteria group bacterium]
MPLPPEIKYESQKALYDPAQDYVSMLRKKSYKEPSGYYAALFHQLIHATAHESRLNRTSILEMSEHGADPYSIEELIAEMGASYLCYHAGILPTPIGDYFAYLNGWLWISFGKILTLLLQQAYMRSGRLTLFWDIKRQPVRKKRNGKGPQPSKGNNKYLT